MARYLVTGGSGFIGSAITRKLVADGHFVRVLDNLSRGSKQNTPKKSNLEFFHADIRDSEGVEAASKDIDVVIHLAYINGTRYFYEKPDLVLDVGVKGMLNVLDAAKKQGVSKLFL